MDLLETSKLMRMQSNRGTQYPLFVVQEENEVRDADGWADKTIYISNAGGDHIEISDETYSTLDDAHYSEEVTDEVKKALEEACLESIEDFNPQEWESLGITVKKEISDRAGFFFTEKSCHDHIESNSYHYNKPRSYVISAWRNPEIVATMQMILKLTGDDIPSQYM